MRWFWIDRFLEFESGRRAVAVKCVSLVEPHVDGYFSGYPVMTPTLVLEGFAQMGGLLVAEQTDFENNIVLAKITRSRIHEYARPGDTLRYTVTAQNLQSDGGLVTAESRLGDRLQLEAELTFAQVPHDNARGDFFEPGEFLRMLRIFGLYHVGVDANGQRLRIPHRLLEAERAMLGDGRPA
jgi:3-hydroxyacyl-[acyl-carrier-protein] dehydratase